MLPLFQKVDASSKTLDAVSNIIKQTLVTHITGVKDTDYRSYYKKLAQKTGFLVPFAVDSITGNLEKNPWTDIVYDEKYVNKAYKHSNKHHPLHTDYEHSPLPLDINFLVCVKPAPYGGGTVFVDPHLLIELLKNYQPGLYERLTTLPVHFSKHGYDYTARESTVITFDEQGPLFSWNYFNARKDSNPEVRQMAEDFHFFLEEYMLGGNLVYEVKLQEGEALFMHDKRVLHGRRAYLGHRHLLKGIISLSDFVSAARKFGIPV